MSCHLINGITSLENDVIDLTHSVSIALDRLVCCYCFLHDLYMFLWLWDYATPVYRRNTLCATKCHNVKWVIIKELYRCLWRYMFGWRISRLGFVTSIVGEVSLGPLGNTHHLSHASIAINELVVGWCITERVKRLAGNEIELGMMIPVIESRASNIPVTKGKTYVVMRFDR